MLFFFAILHAFLLFSGIFDFVQIFLIFFFFFLITNFLLKLLIYSPTFRFFCAYFSAFLAFFSAFLLFFMLILPKIDAFLSTYFEKIDAFFSELYI